MKPNKGMNHAQNISHEPPLIFLLFLAIFIHIDVITANSQDITNTNIPKKKISLVLTNHLPNPLSNNVTI